MSPLNLGRSYSRSSILSQRKHADIRKKKVEVIEKDGEVIWKGLPEEFKQKLDERFDP